MSTKGEVTIILPHMSEDQMKHVHRAEVELAQAGVSFDTGFDTCTGDRHWEFDWSLKGAYVKVKKSE